MKKSEVTGLVSQQAPRSPVWTGFRGMRFRDFAIFRKWRRGTVAAAILNSLWIYLVSVSFQSVVFSFS